MPNDLVHFFAPRTVALIGASPNPSKLGHGVLHNLSRYRGKVYPINPRHSEIAGLPCYPDVAAVPDSLDLAVIVLPTPRIPAVLQACGRQGVKAATIVSNGFKEAGTAGAAIEAKCLSIARRYGMRLIGPNCVGTIDLTTGLNTTFIEGMPEPGPIGFVSQSGGICGAAIDYFSALGVGFSKFVSLGNEADVTETEIIEFLANDVKTKVIAVYVEGINDGAHFMEVARRVSRQKPIVLLKAGRTKAGEVAVSSHTGAMAGSTAAFTAAFQQSGVIEVRSVGNLFDISMALAMQPVPAGDRVFALSNSGGPAALVADHLSELGVPLPALSAHIEAALRAELDPDAQMTNPLDMLGGAGPDAYEFALPLLLSDPAIDAVLVILVPHLLLDPTETARRICRAAKNAVKPIVTCFVGGPNVAEARRIFHQHSIPMYPLPETACQTVHAMCSYARWRQRPQQAEWQPVQPVDRSRVQRLLAGGRHTLGEADTRPVLSAYNIPVVPGGVVHTETEAVQLADTLGYPVVLKLDSPQLLHKTEAGAVRLNLGDALAVGLGVRNLLRVPSPDRASGILVEKMMRDGHEVIIGMRRDPQFGPLLMFGLGGIYVELLTDVAFRVAPLSHAEALAMIHETRAGRLLAGLRGQPAADINQVAECILSLNRLALDFPQIEAVEINPLFVSADVVVALDGRIILSPPKSRREEPATERVLANV